MFYDWGVGSDGNPLTGGATGKGIDKNILDCYRFLVHNYDDGDAVFLFGFSRGAYTVRSLAGLIGNCGILRWEHAGVHTDIGGGYPNHALGDHAGQWLAREAETCGLAFEPHFLDNLAPDTGPQHNQYKGFYRAMRRRIVREVEPVVHVSVRKRWEDDEVRYRSPALRGLLESVGGD